MAVSKNPIAFTPFPVTIFTTLSFIALFCALIAVHNVLPSLPKTQTPAAGVNLTTAWLDLQYLTDGFHPFNSPRNDVIHDWLLRRTESILKENGAFDSKRADNDTVARVFNDNKTDLMFSSSDSALSVAFTGTNIIVYIRGSEDPEGSWWENIEDLDKSKYGVLVNAHFDSVPSGYGATDDGIGVVSVLQIISHFTSPGHQPKRGIIALLNNGEEDYLNGAYAFSQHPTSKFPHTFLNLEGAGAGGRAVLFRSTDTEVTKFYKRSPRPYGNVVSADGFKRRLIRSETDYSVFAPLLGMRGLDVAFMDPRSRYHTIEDAARYTSMKSLWHMLSGALATMEGLTSDTSSTFGGDPTVKGGVSAGRGSDSVWFDMFGRSFAVFELHTLFAISVTFLVVTPFILIALNVALVKTDKWYLFARYSYPEGAHEDEDPVYFRGWRGFFRFPIVFIVSMAALVGLAFLVTKVNPCIAYSSEYAVWR
jgi:Peptidase family M28